MKVANGVNCGRTFRSLVPDRTRIRISHSLSDRIYTAVWFSLFLDRVGVLIQRKIKESL